MTSFEVVESENYTTIQEKIAAVDVAVGKPALWVVSITWEPRTTSFALLLCIFRPSMNCIVDSGRACSSMNRLV